MLHQKLQDCDRPFLVTRFTVLLPGTHSPCVWRGLGWWLPWHNGNLNCKIQKAVIDLVLNNTCLKWTGKQSQCEGLHRRSVQESITWRIFLNLPMYASWVSCAKSLLTCWAGLTVRLASGASPGAKGTLWTWMLCTEVGTWQAEVPSRAQLRSMWT